VIQDNWNIHTHPDVLTALADYPRIKPVWGVVSILNILLGGKTDRFAQRA